MLTFIQEKDKIPSSGGGSAVPRTVSSTTVPLSEPPPTAVCLVLFSLATAAASVPNSISSIGCEGVFEMEKETDPVCVSEERGGLVLYCEGGVEGRFKVLGQIIGKFFSTVVLSIVHQYSSIINCSSSFLTLGEQLWFYKKE